MANTFLPSPKKKTAKRLTIILLSLLLALGVAGVIAAYYSDYFQDTGNVTTPTLKLDVSRTVSLNGTQTTLESIQSLTPGDVIVIAGTASNTGNQSAWVRETISLLPAAEMLPYIRLYNTALTQTELFSATDYSANLIALDNGVATSGNRVINGTDGVTPNIGGFSYIGAASYSFAFTIYFDRLADNTTQNKSMDISFTIQALQFYNNNAQEPNEAAWAAVA